MPASPYYPDTRPDDNWLTPEIRQAGDSPARIVPANSRLDWPALLLISQYRYFVLIVLAGVYYAPDSQGVLGSRDPMLFEIAHLFWCVLALGFTYLIRRKQPSAEAQLYIQSYLDIVCISLLMFASGGIDSGMGPLLLICIALLSHLVAARMALLFAAIGSVTLFSQELIGSSVYRAAVTDLERTGMLGASLFAAAWLISVPVRRLSARDISVPTVFRAGLDVEQIARLNEEIVQELDSGLLVIDSSGHVQVINDSARVLLGLEFMSLPAPLSAIAPELLHDLRDYRMSPEHPSRPITMGDTGLIVLPRYSNLSKGGILLRIEDHSSILAQFQQLKLASLGRLSASIAHEIRNPLGAISHAVQLINESGSLSHEDRGLSEVALKHTARIDRIVNDVLEVSNRPSAAPIALHLPEALADFRHRFISERGLPENQISCSGEQGVTAFVDAGQFDQILWNLCNNALLHNPHKQVSITIDAKKGPTGTTTVDVVDNGDGISQSDEQKVFEPFYSSSESGTGLGLFIVRELCEANKGSIEYVPSDGGAHFRLTLKGEGNLAT